MIRRVSRADAARGNDPTPLIDRAETTAYLILFATLSLHLFGSLVQLAGGRFSPAIAAVLLTLSAAAGHMLARMDGRRPVFFHWAAASLILLLSLLLGGAVFDFTIDGNAYHFQSVDAFAHGWNRLYGIPPQPPAAIPDNIWSLTYPAGHWLVMAVPVASGLPPEAAKGIWIAFGLALVLLGTTTLRRLGLSMWVALPASAVAVANPIFLQQMGTRMNDGVVSLLLLAFGILALAVVALGDRRAMAGLALTVLLVLNTKFSLVPITAALSAIACLLAWRARGVASAVRLGGLLLVAGIAGVLLTGFSPYVANAVNHGHPLYPVMGPNKRDIMTTNTPERFSEVGYPGSFWVSILARTENSKVELKAPFATARREIFFAGYPDPRVAGFGPLFSGILLLSLVTAAACAAGAPLARGQGPALGAAALLLGLAAFFPESWWARYVPFLWLVPVAVALAGALSNRRAPRALAGIVLLAMAANSALVFASAARRSLERTAQIQAELARLEASQEPIRVDFGLNTAFRAMVKRNGIPHDEVSFASEGACPGAERLAGSINDLQGFRCPITAGAQD